MEDIKLIFKICVIGDGAVGKTSFCKKLFNNGFNSKYIPTLGVEIYPILIKTNYGNILVNLWDTAGQEKFGGLRDGWYLGSKAFIIMFDVSSKSSYKNIQKWYDSIMRICPNILVVLCGNKTDLINNRIIYKNNIKYEKQNITYLDISVKNNINLNKVLLTIIQNLTNIKNIKFLDKFTLYNKIDDDVYKIDDDTVEMEVDITHNLLVETADPLPIKDDQRHSVADGDGIIKLQNELQFKKSTKKGKRERCNAEIDQKKDELETIII